ncbi:formylglycine-generating enzyme family protein [Labrenzia sp. R4_2]|uniref:SUMF1/EgtB/PvdO family nonheme iron enzyme n=1 Tax=Labrenzia sp. R4_2 TaxID=2821107 RepID=UPI001AD9A1DD|nr:SUMF1/EgtB/PvdO family nonheme iron enzyme [Labrenzia sp. R4_2]MBO9419526.1 formylglycine-generating enzyme family protein [Labrenzia sp. R4_2]
MRSLTCLFLMLAFAGNAKAEEMVNIGSFEIDRTEVTIGAFREFIDATNTTTSAEIAGGGEVYESGWVQKPGWTWRTPFGLPALDTEPAVHVTFEEASAYCGWRGKRLPTDAEWGEAAYTERRISPPAPFEPGVTYPYPTGKSPEGANCLEGCGASPALDVSAVLRRGTGHAPAGTTRPGVNGLYDMGANVWEWTENGAGGQKTTRGGSWWYGPRQMHRDHIAKKSAGTAVVYIGFRCARSL